MAKHKSATEVTVVTEDKSLLQQWVDKHWIKAAGIGVVVGGAVLFSQFQNQSATKAKGDRWNGLLAAEGNLDDVQAATNEIEDPNIKGWGEALVAFEAMAAEKPAVAAESLAELASNPDHILNSTAFGIETEAGRISPAAYAQDALSSQVEWEAAHPTALDNPAPAEGSPKVVIHTSVGDIEITFYEAEAPKHVENFLKLVAEDFYNDILFHRVVNNRSMSIIQAGDPNTKEEDVTKWGQGGPGYTQPVEKNDLMHCAGYLAAAMPGNSQESSGSQFYISVARSHGLDGRYVVFGKITAGLDVATKILEAPIRDPEGGATDIPVDPVSITSIEAL